MCPAKRQGRKGWGPGEAPLQGLRGTGSILTEAGHPGTHDASRVERGCRLAGKIAYQAKPHADSHGKRMLGAYLSMPLPILLSYFTP